MASQFGLARQLDLQILCQLVQELEGVQVVCALHTERVRQEDVMAFDLILPVTNMVKSSNNKNIARCKKVLAETFLKSHKPIYVKASIYIIYLQK